MAAGAVLFVQRDVADHVALESAVMLEGEIGEAVLRGVVDVHAIQDRKSRRKRVADVHSKLNIVDGAVGSDRPKTSAWIGSQSLGLR